MRLTRHRDDGPVLITAAEPSLSEQHEARKRKYLIMMGLRVVCLLLAGVFYRVTWLMAVFAVGAVALPWMAVLIANDRPPKRAMRLDRYHGAPPADRQLPPTTGSGASGGSGDSTVVDADE